MVARARLSADERTIEEVKVLLNAEGAGGRVIQARDGTLLVTSSVPAGVGIDSSDWPQPQQLDSLMGKVLRINAVAPLLVTQALAPRLARAGRATVVNLTSGLGSIAGTAGRGSGAGSSALSRSQAGRRSRPARTAGGDGSAGNGSAGAASLATW